MRRLAAAAAATAWLLAGTAAPAAASELRTAIERDYHAHLRPLFEHFHRNPELSTLETQTAARLAQELRAAGFEVTEGVGGTGVVAVLRNGAGPTVLLRADMDGLPVQEKTGLPYASTARQVDLDGEERWVMHACGHDVHMTALVGAARRLAAMRKSWSGTLVLIGQPAEERLMGARAMLADGLYTRFPKPDYAVAFHVGSDLPAGKIRVPTGVAYSSSDSVDMYVYGVGAHGASPHRGVDPVLVASQIVVSLQSVVSRSVDPLQPAVITVGAIHGGTKHNIIPEEVHLQLTVRSQDLEVRRDLLDGIDRVALGVALAHGVPTDRLPKVVRSPTQTTPPTINHAPTAERLRARFGAAFPAGTVIDPPPQGMGAEDFAYLVAPEHGVKGVYFRVGGTPEGELETAPSHHSPYFKIDPEPSIRVGTESMVLAALELLKRR